MEEVKNKLDRSLTQWRDLEKRARPLWDYFVWTIDNPEDTGEERLVKELRAKKEQVNILRTKMKEIMKVAEIDQAEYLLSNYIASDCYAKIEAARFAYIFGRKENHIQTDAKTKLARIADFVVLTIIYDMEIKDRRTEKINDEEHIWKKEEPWVKRVQENINERRKNPDFISGISRILDRVKKELAKNKAQEQTGVAKTEKLKELPAPGQSDNEDGSIYL